MYPICYTDIHIANTMFLFRCQSKLFQIVHFTIQNLLVLEIEFNSMSYRTFLNPSIDNKI